MEAAMDRIRHKRSLGQHFLKEEHIAGQVAASLDSAPKVDQIVEVGPGQGVLTKYLVDRPEKLHLVELDQRLIDPLKARFPAIADRIVNEDFLRSDLSGFKGTLAVIGNYPYNISSQILFKVLENRDRILFMSGMFQKEVAARIAGPSGNKDYGVLSVLAQAYFDVAYLFDVPPTAFDPPPQVDSGVISMVRKDGDPPVKYEDLRKVVKAAFSMRRKTLRNCLKSLIEDKALLEQPLFDKRAEQLTVQDFIDLTQTIYS
jgi:16S rRNA (adenine1518-N6/adenine1519-N6)-dimethyltransferase